MTLFELFGLLRKHLKFVLAVPIAAALVCGIVTLFMPNRYTADVSMYVLAQQQDTSNSSSQSTYSDLSASQMIANDVATIAKSDRVKASVASSLGMDSLNGYDIEINSSTTTRIITLSVTGKDSQTAADIANAYVDSISDTVKGVMSVDSVNAINQAEVPTHPSGPNRLLYVCVTFLIGLFVSIIIVVIADMANTKARRDDDVVELLNIPVVGHFPSID
jgi:capsular polysaccharide biosynthesis protein